MRIFILAGEASGDRLGAALMVGLKSETSVEFQGVGGPLMQGEGLSSLFPMDELSVMGIVEVLPKYRHLKRRIAETAEAVIAMQPDVMITIDSPDFSLRVAKIVKARSNIRTVHYVAPTVWAWRAGRAAKMAKVIDHVLALFPFEPPYMQAEGMECDFVGHPVVAEPQASDTEVADFRARHDIGDAPLLLVLPGSRRGEVGRLGPIFGRALTPLLTAHPNLLCVVPTTAHVAPLLREVTDNWPVKPIILDPSEMKIGAYKTEKAAAFRASDGALAASGTVSLELAAAETPMVIAYDVNWISRQIIAYMLRIDTLTLVNLISETRDIPECNGKHCNPAEIGAALLSMMAAPDKQLAAMRLTMERLGKGGEAPGLRAAKAVLARI
ncbi:lipid-A-disaccharide synthase [Roseovarius sp. LXJ103]|uniref:lipid-A-disaccharide synthase n=1 Tax=Roseovarius carneus TaxID=2853164 RepID=UPI000D620518|nr:lipid-A-disaccharide synthase [Roseovarius carneus]MBZ8119462.1 lipid-A-disaccharide synthase [Roseovarius carneus]PWE34903.1 lipid-A-disaccharide synthase [Pelagicola sp. LXJ1103]